MINNDYDAMVTAIALTITAPNDEKFNECLAIADEFGARATYSEWQCARVDALALTKEMGF